MQDDKKYETIMIDEKDCMPTVQAIAEVFVKRGTTEPVAYVSLRILLKQIEQNMEIIEAIEHEGSGDFEN